MNKKFLSGFMLMGMVILSNPKADAQSAYFQAVTNLNPAGYWPMHDVLTPAQGYLETNYGSIGSLANGYYADWGANNTVIVHQVAGPITNSLGTTFNSQTLSYLLVPRTSAQTLLKPPFTEETWFKPVNGSFGDIISQGPFGQNNGGSQSGNRYGVRLSWGGTFQVYVGNGTNTQNNSFSSGSFASGQWYHVALTYDGTNWNLYVNGNSAATSTLPMGLDPSDPITIGEGFWQTTGQGRATTNSQAEVAIYGSVLSQTDIQKHYDDGTNSNEAQYAADVMADSPLIYFHMNAPAKSLPATNTWPVLTNYGTAGNNGYYTPGTQPGAFASVMPFANLGSDNTTPFNGLDSFADAGTSSLFNPTGSAATFSISAMFKGNPTDSRIQSICGHGTNSWQVVLNTSGKLVFNAGTSGNTGASGTASGDLTSAHVFNDGLWHFFVATHNGTNNALYVDGQIEATNTSSTSIPGATRDVLIGADPSFTNNPTGIGRQFAGEVCEVAFFTNQLQGSDVQNLLNAAGIQPYFAQQPVSGAVNAGSSFTNTTRIVGSAPLFYQWYENNAPLNGQTNAILVLSPVQASNNSTNYYLVVTNAYGAVTSSVVSLTVNLSPTILSQLPQTYTNLYTLFAGSSPAFSISASGALPLYFQWYTNGVAVSGATNSTFMLADVQEGYITNYCVISNSVGTLTSTVWAASVIAAPVGPYPQAVLALNPVGYWRLNEPDDGLSDGNPGAVMHDYVGGNDGVYTNTLLGQTGYSQGVANQFGYSPATDPSETSALFGNLPGQNNVAYNVAGIDFSAPTNTARSFSISAWVNGGSQANGAGIVSKGFGNGGEQFDMDVFNNNFRFFVRDAGGNVHGPTSTFTADGRWHYVVGVCDESNGVVSLYIDGSLAGQSTVSATAGILTSTNLMSIGARKSSATVTNFDFDFVGDINDVAIFNYALSAAQIFNNYIAVGVPPIFTEQPPTNVTVAEGDTLTISGAVVTGDGPFTYQWQDAYSGALAGQTNITLTLEDISVNMNGHTLYLTASNPYGSVNSSNISLTVISGPPQIIASNLSPNLLLPSGKVFTYTAQAAGTLPISYQWYSGTTPLAGQTGTNFTFTAGAPGSTNITVVVSNVDGTASATSALTVIALPTDPYSSNILSLNPVGYWPLQETNAPSQSVTMETNYGTLGELGNAYYAMTAGISSPRFTFGQGGALTASGDNDTAVQFSSPSGTNYAFVPLTASSLVSRPPLTYEVWINTSSTVFADIMGQGGAGLNSGAGSGNYGGIRLSYANGSTTGSSLQVYAYNGNAGNYNSFSTAANTLAYGVWHHCVMTHDGANCILYIDGQPQITNALTYAVNTWTPLTIGDSRWLGDSGTTGPTRGYSGMIDEVAVYTNVLSPDRVLAHYTAATTTTGSSYVQTVMADAPLLYYRMDAPGFVAPQPGTYPPAVNYGTAQADGAYPGGILPGGVAGPSILGLSNSVAAPINGVISAINAGSDPSFDPSGHQPFSVMFWCKGYPADGRLQTMVGNGSANWSVNMDGTTGHAVWNLGNAGQVNSTSIINDGNWHQVAGVYDGTTSYLYVDGALNNSAAAGAGGLTAEPNASLYLGGDSDYVIVGSNQRYFAGALAQVAVFTNALTAGEIAENYQLATTPSVPAISLNKSGGDLVITYTGTLRSSTNAAGPYTPVPGATSPYIVPQTDAQRFYRSSNP